MKIEQLRRDIKGTVVEQEKLKIKEEERNEKNTRIIELLDREGTLKGQIFGQIRYQLQQKTI